MVPYHRSANIRARALGNGWGNVRYLRIVLAIGGSGGGVW